MNKNPNEYETGLLHNRYSEMLTRDQLDAFELLIAYLRRWESVCGIKRRRHHKSSKHFSEFRVAKVNRLLEIERFDGLCNRLSLASQSVQLGHQGER